MANKTKSNASSLLNFNLTFIVDSNIFVPAHLILSLIEYSNEGYDETVLMHCLVLTKHGSMEESSKFPKS